MNCPLPVQPSTLHWSLLRAFCLQILRNVRGPNGSKGAGDVNVVINFVSALFDWIEGVMGGEGVERE